ncbi:hypothetical protein BDA96_01G334000 [Sorghum bicolor]|uniref:Uncharacterized protein n=2 Tax=Sorghum bicolor TaxID=4558 RepID=A0A921V257_SORBI|nr:hypothetical protein BDA96_01G334000 [Sorghum bicolor]KXG38994.1 hypothetical protein SORBI_3001G311400 [Sorghum bicolor]
MQAAGAGVADDDLQLLHGQRVAAPAPHLLHDAGHRVPGLHHHQHLLAAAVHPDVVHYGDHPHRLLVARVAEPGFQSWVFLLPQSQIYRLKIKPIILRVSNFKLIFTF